MSNKNLSEKSLKDMLDRIIKAKAVGPVAIKPTNFILKSGK